MLISQPYAARLSGKYMLARIKKEGWVYIVEAYISTPDGPKWVPISETKSESLALELREYVRYHATTQYVNNMIEMYKARLNRNNPF